MASPQILHIEVVYAQRDRQRVVKLVVAPGTTAHTAIELSGLACEFPEIAAMALEIGIFGQRVGPQRLLRDGDRVEVYRPLQVDPKQARRKRARVQR